MILTCEEDISVRAIAQIAAKQQAKNKRRFLFLMYREFETVKDKISEDKISRTIS